MFEPDCLLMQDETDLRTRDCRECERCGWNPKVEMRRKEFARRYKMPEALVNWTETVGKGGDKMVINHRAMLKYIPAMPEK